MFWTAALMAASMAVLAGTVSKVNSSPPGSAASYVAAVFLYLFNTWFAFGWLGMTWLYPPEISSIRIRASASSIATTANWLFNFLIVLISMLAFLSYRAILELRTDSWFDFSSTTCVQKHWLSDLHCLCRAELLLLSGDLLFLPRAQTARSGGDGCHFRRGA